MDFRFDIIYEYRWMFFYGVLATLGITVVATIGGSILGLLLALARLVNPEKAGAPIRALAWVLRKISLCMLRCSAVRHCLLKLLFGLLLFSHFLYILPMVH